MRKFLTTAMAVALASATSYADLQNVEIGGGIRTRAAGYFFDDSGSNRAADQFIEQRTNLKFTADFTDEVSAVIEIDNHGFFGSDNRAINSNTDFPTGGQFFAGADQDSMHLYQAYIELREAWGSAVDLKIGRQEIILGSEFLVGNQNTAGEFTGLSFDGVTAVYNADTYSVTAIAVKVDEADATFDDTSNDRDQDLYGLYFSYTGREDMTIDAYWLFLDQGIADTKGNELHTIGVRVAGEIGMFDYEVEVASQTGDVNSTEDYEGFALNSELGYTFDTNLQPRVFGGVTIFSGEDAVDEQGFNRLFSDWEYTELIANADFTNVVIYRIGVSIQATEKIALGAILSSYQVDEEDDFTTGGLNAAPQGDVTEDDIGEELGLYFYYSYSEDVNIEAGVARLFLGDKFTDDEQDYAYLEISLSF